MHVEEIIKARATQWLKSEWPDFNEGTESQSGLEDGASHYQGGGVTCKTRKVLASLEADDPTEVEQSTIDCN